MFSLRNITYKNILQIDTLELEKKKVTCLVGESGSGKTTLLRLLNQLITQDKGDIYYNDQNILTIDSVLLRREVVMLPQIPVIFPGTIKENLLIGLRFSEKEFVSDKILEETLQFVELNKNLTDLSDHLSGGEKQRLALGRVLLLDPNVFLLDEPSSALDEKTEEVIIKKLANFVRQNDKTLIIVTHSKKIAQIYADQIIELRQGKVYKEVK